MVFQLPRKGNVLYVILRIFQLIKNWKRNYSVETIHKEHIRNYKNKRMKVTVKGTTTTKTKNSKQTPLAAINKKGKEMTEGKKEISLSAQQEENECISI